MYRKLAVTGLLIWAILLAGCTPVPPERVEQPATPTISTAPEYTIQQNSAPTPVPSILAGCTNVRSYEFNMGAAVGTRICLEGVIEKIVMPGPDNQVEISFDTATGKNSGSLYNVTVFIPDGKAFGLDIIKQLTSGMYIAVKGQFSQGWSVKSFIATFYIEITRPDDLAVLG